jgi:hypothetical protein
MSTPSCHAAVLSRKGGQKTFKKATKRSLGGAFGREAAQGHAQSTPESEGKVQRTMPPKDMLHITCQSGRKDFFR